MLEEIREIVSYPFSITDILTCGKFKYPKLNWGVDFFNRKLLEIDQHIADTDISYSESRSDQWQHKITFTNSHNEKAVISMWYNKHGYSRKNFIVFYNSAQFAQHCLAICNDWGVLPVPRPNPNRMNATRLYEIISKISEECDIELVNFVEGDYSDMFYLKTDGEAIISFNYNASMK